MKSNINTDLSDKKEIEDKTNISETYISEDKNQVESDVLNKITYAESSVSEQALIVADSEKVVSGKNKPEDYDTVYPYALCDYKNCPEYKECKYLKSPYTASSIDNDAVKLCRNFEVKYPLQYQEYIQKNEQMNSESTEGNWTIAAHHIISGNQIFAKHPYLVKLANYYDYDINNAENCVLLPSTHSFDGKTGITKQANGYVAMDLMKQQWHVGGHSYSLDEETVEQVYRYLEKISYLELEFYRNYVEAVEHEINLLEARYKKISCRKLDYTIKQKNFIDNMNRISEKVGNRIHEFENGYKKSYPYYVSKEAYKFAFDVPNRKKFIIIYPKTKYNKVYNVAAIFKVTRYKKDNYEVLFSDSEELVIADSRSFICFSDNVKYFINLTDDFVLPWKIDITREYVMNDIFNQNSVSEYCQENKQKIISFVEGRENGEMYYDSATKIVRQRLNCMIT